MNSRRTVREVAQMTPARGFAYVREILILVAAVGVAACVWWIAEQIKGYGERRYKEGKAEVMALWQAEALQSAKDDVDAQRGRQLEARAQAKNLQEANRRAEDAEAQLRRHREENQNVPAATVQNCPAVAGGPAPVVRLNWGWVRDYDAAWSGTDGQPLFRDRPDLEGAAEPADAPSPYTLGDLLERHAGNAAKCSRTARQLTRLLETLDRLEAQEDARRKP